MSKREKSNQNVECDNIKSNKLKKLLPLNFYKKIFDLFHKEEYDMLQNMISIHGHDFDINMTDKFGRTLFFIACQQGNDVVVKMLLQHPKIDSNKCVPIDNITPLYTACQFYHKKVVEILLKYPYTNVNKSCVYDGSTPLIIVCSWGNTELVEMLLNNKNTDLNKADNNGYTPLFLACKWGHEEIVEILLADDRTKRIRPNDIYFSKVYNKALRNVISKRNAKFRGLIRAAIVFKRMQLRAALKIYAPGGAGFHAASASFAAAIDR